jgi:hypothetical protein
MHFLYPEILVKARNDTRQAYRQKRRWKGVLSLDEPGLIAQSMILPMPRNIALPGV